MNKEPFKYNELYQSDCECGKTMIVSTQRDNFPEYETEVFIKCECERWIYFELPVN